jgi:Kyakuja-Dileera-Zisupton transposase
VAYDIGCAFQKTVESSSLGPKFRAFGHRMCVNAFHGYSHNFACQTKNHPNIIKGMGIEDLETLERVFSSSNQLAPIIRYATAFHRRVFLDMFFKQWDEEKYQNLSTMLRKNYLQALDIIKDESPLLLEAMRSLKIQDGDIEKWHREQVEYFATVGNEPEWDVHAVAYVELLQELIDIE